MEVNLVDAVHVGDRACECFRQILSEDNEFNLEFPQCIISRHKKPFNVELWHSEQPTVVVKDLLNCIL